MTSESRVTSAGLYLDTSCLLKLLFREPESARVAKLVEAEPRVVVSELCTLEASVQIQGRRLASLLDAASAKRLETALERLLASDPFELVPVAPESLSRARAQTLRAKKGGHCRTLDRLHLGVMETEGLRRLLSNDDQQAAAARALGIDVLMP
ncbi:MAG TPA: type II toxin-antitoxin system VapC family toxin [Polyangiaceae bacterium]